MTLVQDHGLLDEQVFVKLSTDMAHIVTDEYDSVCEIWEYDEDKVHHRGDEVVYDHKYFHTHGIVHEDDGWWPIGVSLCHYCDQHVPDELQQQLFTDEKFGQIEGLTDGSE